MRRRLLNLLTAGSLLLFVAVMAIWARSYSRFDVRYVERNNVCWRLRSESGEVSYVVAGTPRPSWQTVRLSGPVPEHGRPGWVDERHVAFTFLGFRAGTGSCRFDDVQPWSWMSSGVKFVVVPYWLPAALVAALPAALLPGALRVRRRRRRGLCPRCGYDLTGNAGGVCPECGAAAGAAGAA